MADASPQITWSQFDLSDMIPGILETIDDALGPLDAAYQVVGNAAIAAALLNSGFNLAAGTINAAFAALVTVRDQVRQLLQDIKNSGVSLLSVPPRDGGPSAFGNEVRVHLLNTADPRRPVLSDASFTGSWGAFATAPSNVDCDELFESIVGFTHFKEEFKAASGFEEVKPSLELNLSHNLQLLRGSAALPPPFFQESAWLTATIKDFVPGMEELFRIVDAMFTSLINAAGFVTPKVLRYIDFINAQLARFTALITGLQTLIDSVRLLFTQVNFNLFTIPVFQGGTDMLSQFIPSAFDPAQQAGIANVEANSWATGFIFVYGGVDETIATNPQTVFSSIFQGLTF